MNPHVHFHNKQLPLPACFVCSKNGIIIKIFYISYETQLASDLLVYLGEISQEVKRPSELTISFEFYAAANIFDSFCFA